MFPTLNCKTQLKCYICTNPPTFKWNFRGYLICMRCVGELKKDINFIFNKKTRTIERKDNGW